MKPKGGTRFSTGTQIFLVTLLNINCLLLNSFHFFLWQYACAVERKGGRDMEKEKSKTYNVVKNCKVENHGGISETVKLLLLISLQITFQSKKTLQDY